LFHSSSNVESKVGEVGEGREKVTWREGEDDFGTEVGLDDGATPAVQGDGGGDSTTSTVFFISEVRP